MQSKAKFLCFSLILLSCTDANAASFDCNKARTSTERLICSNPTLGRLDSALAENYLQMMTADFGGSKSELKAEQRRWLKKRDQCKDESCLIKMYRARVDETCDYGVVSGVHPICTMSSEIE